MERELINDIIEKTKFMEMSEVLEVLRAVEKRKDYLIKQGQKNQKIQKALDWLQRPTKIKLAKELLGEDMYSQLLKDGSIFETGDKVQCT